MVQILPAEKRRPSTGQRLGEALGQALNTGVQMYQQHQKQNRYGEALKGVENIYADTEMTPEQKFVKAFSTLREFPEAAKQFTSGMSQFAESPLQAAQREKLLQEIHELKGEEDYFGRLTGDNQKSKSFGENDIKSDMSEMGNESFDVNKPRMPNQKPKFDFNDSSTWTDKQIDNFRAYEGKNAKGKSLAKKANNEFERRKESKKSAAKYQADIVPLQGALKTINEMEKLGTKGNLGIGTKVRGIFSPNTRRDAAEYERLGKSLISFSSNIPIRNRQEFETLAHDLYDPSISDDAREGILSAMKTIIQNSMKSFTAQEEAQEHQTSEASPSREPTSNERPPLTSFFR